MFWVHTNLKSEDSISKEGDTMKITKSRYYPENSKIEVFDDIKYEIGSYVNYKGKPCAICYGGRRNKPDWSYQFENEDKRDNHINKFLQERYSVKEQRENQKKEQKAKEEKAFKDLKPGDVFVSSFGYSMTIVDFYQLISIKGKTGTFRAISGDVVSGNAGYTGEVKPVKDDFVGETFTARLKGDSFKTPKYGYQAHKTSENNSFYFNRMD